MDHHSDVESQPLLSKEKEKPRSSDQTTLIQKVISQTFQSTAHLANLLPTGTVLSFQLLSPLFTNQGNCNIISRYLTSSLVALCALSCFIFSFSDSFRDESGTVRYGMATLKGLWVIDGSESMPLEKAVVYKIKFIDFMHGFMSVLVFAAVALFDQNMCSCFYPVMSDDVKQVLAVMPVAIGVVCSMMFVTFPSTRHGVGFPLCPRRFVDGM